MTGIAVGILWLGYTAFATGRLYAKGIPVTFSDMVLPKYRNATLALIANYNPAEAASQGASKPPAPSSTGGGYLTPGQPGNGGLINQGLGFLTGGLLGDKNTAPWKLFGL